MTRDDVLHRLRSALPLIAPSMLKCDFGDLKGEIQRLEAAGAQSLHLDVMDGQFVPNLSYGPPVIERLRPLTDLVFDAHLMIADPARYLHNYIDAGCNCLTVHVEAVPEPAALLGRIQEAGAVAGLALNPGTPMETIVQALPWCDLVLVMSVEPGFGGQKFMPSAIGKLHAIHNMIQPGTLLAVDGGIGPSTIVKTAEAGANVFVAGSAIFAADDYATAMAQLASLAGQAAA